MARTVTAGLASLRTVPGRSRFCTGRPMDGGLSSGASF